MHPRAIPAVLTANVTSSTDSHKSSTNLTAKTSSKSYFIVGILQIITLTFVRNPEQADIIFDSWLKLSGKWSG